MSESELDVRGMPKPAKHPAIFAAFAELACGDAFVLINDHDPRPLRGEFEIEYGDGFGWEYLRREPKDWRIRISKLTVDRLPRVLVDLTAVGGSAFGTDAGPAGTDDPSGVLWKLQMRERDLDSNVVALPPGGAIDRHHGPDLDVLLQVLAGSGELQTERDTIALRPGQLLWLPRRSQRAFRAGDEGLRYLTVHQRRQSLILEPPPPRQGS